MDALSRDVKKNLFIFFVYFCFLPCDNMARTNGWISQDAICTYYKHMAVYNSGHVQGPSIYLYIYSYIYTHTYGSIQIRARAKTVRYALQGSSSQIAAGSTRLLCYRSSGTFYYRSSWKVIYYKKVIMFQLLHINCLDVLVLDRLPTLTIWGEPGHICMYIHTHTHTHTSIN